MSPDASVTDPENQKVDNELSKQFSEIFLKKQENISSLLELLEVTYYFLYSFLASHFIGIFLHSITYVLYTLY